MTWIWFYLSERTSRSRKGFHTNNSRHLFCLCKCKEQANQSRRVRERPQRLPAAAAAGGPAGERETSLLGRRHDLLPVCSTLRPGRLWARDDARRHVLRASRAAAVTARPLACPHQVRTGNRTSAKQSNSDKFASKVSAA